MCIPNSDPFDAMPLAELRAEVKRLNWAAEIREKELDRLFEREKVFQKIFRRIKYIADSPVDTQLKPAMISSELSNSPVFPIFPRHEIPNSER